MKTIRRFLLYVLCIFAGAVLVAAVSAGLKAITDALGWSPWVIIAALVLGYAAVLTHQHR